ncbi:MAG: TraB/GumN family protein [Oscillospiraceae bacterium]|nr:TraB/GumN family protein [Oscillospiraceae bacterium]
MKNVKIKKILSLLIVAVMLITSSAYVVVSASDAPPPGAATTDIYSSWAYWDVSMAQDVYGLGNEGTYSNFRGVLSEPKFQAVIDSLNSKFGTDEKTEYKDPDAVTRGEVIDELYKIIGAALKLDNMDTVSACDYFVQNGLINGRADGDYQLDQTCTVQEMIVFAKRVYENLSYALGLDSKGFCWKVTGTGDNDVNTVYLFGTIHFGDSSLYPLSKAIEDAFASSKNLGVEADISAVSQEDQQYMMDKGFIKDGTTIEDLISADTYKLYADACQKLGLPETTYDYLQPWMAYLLLSDMMTASGSSSDTGSDAMAAAQKDALLGIDMHFLNEAAADGNKNIISLESLKFQVDLLDSFSPELQEYLLNSLVSPQTNSTDADAAANSSDSSSAAVSAEDQASIVHQQFLQMLDMIKKGDDTTLVDYLGLNSLESDNPIITEYNNKFIIDRNKAMAEKIESFLSDADSGGDYFIAVGAAHIIGDYGVVKILIDEGYTVERVG